MAADLAALFTDIGIVSPGPVPVMRADHQIAQKLHALSSEASERARDLVDLQLLDGGEELEAAQVNTTCARLFDYRRKQPWPPTIVAGDDWDTLYVEAAEGVSVLPTVEEAVRWANGFIAHIAATATTR